MTYVHKDHLGSPVAATDQTGSVLWREHYLPFGEKLSEAPSNRNDEGFTGHIADSQTDLTYMQARYYDPRIGRFLSNDPAPFRAQSPATFNRYAYASNDPVNAFDPDGMQTSFDIRFRQRQEALARGEITEEEYRSQNYAESKGAIAGLAILAAGYTGGRSLLWLRGKALANPVTTSEVSIAIGELGAGDALMGGLFLGLSNQGLKQAASLYEGRTLMGSTDLVGDFLAALGDQSQKFVFRLDGVKGDTPKEMFENLLTQGKQAAATGSIDGNATAWEAYKLHEAGRLDDVTFTIRDEIVDIFGD